MSFNFDALNLDTNHPAMLSKIRAIEEGDPQILQDLKEQYSKVDKDTDFKIRALLTLLCSIILQERLYFALTRRQLQDLLKRDTNLGEYAKGIGNGSWSKLLAWLYNEAKLFELIHAGTKKRASAYRLSDKGVGKIVVKYLLDKGVDGKVQKEEVLKFVTAE